MPRPCLYPGKSVYISGMLSAEAKASFDAVRAILSTMRTDLPEVSVGDVVEFVVRTFDSLPTKQKAALFQSQAAIVMADARQWTREG